MALSLRQTDSGAFNFEAVCPSHDKTPVHGQHGETAVLVLTRKIGEEIIIDNDIRISVVAVQGDRVRLGITAPKDMRVDRREIYERRRRQLPGEPAD
jgi:carbon storage regulator